MANFIEGIFGKLGEKLTLQDVEEFFKERQEETATLEFKSGDITPEKLFKSVAGFLNSEGGLLIVGSPKEREDKVNEHLRVKYAKGELIPCNSFKTRESITQKIGSNIVPPPAGIKIWPFYSDSSAVYLIEVPQSVSPPHQVQQSGMYYFRNDNTTVPASYGVVSALFNQRRVPRLMATVDFEPGKRESELEFQVTITNESDYPADKVGYMVNIYNGYDIKGNIRSEFRVDATTEFDIKHFKAVFPVDMVMPKGIGERKKFKLVHLKKPIFISTVHWSLQNTTRGVYIWIDPDGEVVESTDDPREGEQLLAKFFDYLKADPGERIVLPSRPIDPHSANVGPNPL